MKKILNLLFITPYAISGLCLAVGTYGWIWFLISNGKIIYPAIFSLLSLCLICLLIIKIIIFPKTLLVSLTKPSTSFVLSTLPMSIIVFSKILKGVSIPLETTVWLSGVVIHCFFFIIITYFQLRNFEFKKMNPGWFIPSVGIVTCAIASPGGSFTCLAQFFTLWGVVVYLFILPFMLFRLFISSPLGDEIKQSIAIMDAPASLCLLGVLSIIKSPPIALIATLSVIAIMMSLITIYYLRQLLRIPLNPGCSALTFPLVVSSIAYFRLNKWIISIHGYSLMTSCVMILAFAMSALATFTIGLTCYAYYLHYKN